MRVLFDADFRTVVACQCGLGEVGGPKRQPSVALTVTGQHRIVFPRHEVIAIEGPSCNRTFDVAIFDRHGQRNTSRQKAKATTFDLSLLLRRGIAVHIAQPIKRALQDIAGCDMVNQGIAAFARDVRLKQRPLRCNGR
jgi:hypothetical protein